MGYGTRHAGCGHAFDHEGPTRHALHLGALSADSAAQPSFVCVGKDDDNRRAPEPVIAKWLASGVLEFAAWNEHMPILLQPCGAVPKWTAPSYRLITDACCTNKLYLD